MLATGQRKSTSFNSLLLLHNEFYVAKSFLKSKITFNSLLLLRLAFSGMSIAIGVLLSILYCYYLVIIAALVLPAPTFQFFIVITFSLMSMFKLLTFSNFQFFIVITSQGYFGYSCCLSYFFQFFIVITRNSFGGAGVSVVSYDLSILYCYYKIIDAIVENAKYGYLSILYCYYFFQHFLKHIGGYVFLSILYCYYSSNLRARIHSNIHRLSILYCYYTETAFLPLRSSATSPFNSLLLLRLRGPRK